MQVTIAKPRLPPAREFDLRQDKAKYMCECAYMHIREMLTWINGAASGEPDARGMRKPADETDPVFGAGCRRWFPGRDSARPSAASV